jgi:lipopolysaccharide biosynthesis glycosyltransferase
MSERIRIFVACTPVEWLSARVLEFSILQHTKSEIEFVQLYQANIEIPEPVDLRNKSRTPFSFQRFLIPELCGYQGKAIYLDADMLVFSDILEIWTHPFNSAKILAVKSDSASRGSQYSVLLQDCAALNWKISDIIGQLDSGELTYESLMFDMRLGHPVSFDLPANWNSLECFVENDTALLHYTDMNFQPWVSIKNPLRRLWVNSLQDAITQGFISRSELDREIAAGNVRPSLSFELDNFEMPKQKLDSAMLDIDRHFVEPYTKLASFRRGSIRLLFSRLIARLKRLR